MSAAEEARDKVEVENQRFQELRGLINVNPDDADYTKFLGPLVQLVAAQHHSLVALLLAVEELEDR